MAVIDTFLKLLVAQRAERLVLAPDEVPTLFKAEEAIELSMPAVPPDLLERLSAEVLQTSQLEGVTRDLPGEGLYQTADGEEFRYAISTDGVHYRLEMHVLATEEDTEVPRADDPAPTPEQPLPVPSERSEDSSASPPVKAALAAPAPPASVLAALDAALQAGASDLFLSSEKVIQMRVNGILQPLSGRTCSKAEILSLLPNEEARGELASSGNVDFGATWTVSGQRERVRANLFRHAHGVAVALRPILKRIPSLAELELPSDLVDLCSYPSGLVLVTGASGSGKSTTLAALIEHLNQARARHIITIEDPIEYQHREAKALIHQREVGSDVASFSSGLRAALRENPDVILLGEMRDLATISAALTAAETGHLVLSTLHTGNATAAVNRIVDVYPGHQQAHVRVQLAASLRAVIAQRLVPTTDQAGRLPAIEKLIVTPAVANGIRDGHEHHMQSAMQTGADDGMITLERSLAALARRGRISRDTAYRHAADQQALAKLLD